MLAFLENTTGRGRGSVLLFLVVGQIIELEKMTESKVNGEKSVPPIPDAFLLVIGWEEETRSRFYPSSKGAQVFLFILSSSQIQLSRVSWNS